MPRLALAWVRTFPLRHPPRPVREDLAAIPHVPEDAVALGQTRRGLAGGNTSARVPGPLRVPADCSLPSSPVYS